MNTMLKCKICGHETDEGTLELREFCKGCGLTTKDDSPQAWDEFLNDFDEVEE